MSDIFISYAREDLENARQLAAVLEAQGWSVFWDRTIPPGKTWRDLIGQALSDARSMVVLWSKHSVNSQWVLEEADYGRNRQVLVPTFIENVDAPLGFGGIQAADLTNWTGKVDHHGLNVLIAAITDILREQSSPETTPSEPEIPAEGEGTTSEIKVTAKIEETRTPTPERTPTSGKSDLGTPPPVTPPRGRNKTGIFIAAVIALVVIATVLVMRNRTEEPEVVNEPESVEQSWEVKEPEMVEIPGTNYAIGKYEVTFNEYDGFARATGRDLPGDEGWGRGNRPVINISWEDAASYAEWLEKHTGKRYRLPTDEQWNHANVAGTTTAYWWGDEVGVNKANCRGCGSTWDGEKTSPVGSFGPNPFGLYDTLGNVWEWLQDCYQEDCSWRTIRGGSWDGGPLYLRTASRNAGLPMDRNSSIGFRLARDL